ncbi:MAG: hypothetical protein U5K30_11770 [Acidimicrobiales bacterium]|nr:hypothetical protein [Acidimicrobiales bacterium]
MEADDVYGRVDGRGHGRRAVFLHALELLPNIGLIAVLFVGGHRVDRRCRSRSAR